MSTDSYGFDGVKGRIFVRRWDVEAPRFVALISHGYGEHVGRYEHVAAELNGVGATVYAPDHLGHGQSEGERVSIDGMGIVVEDLHTVADQARKEHPDLPVVLIGHSMGGLIATRFAQVYPGELAALVLSGPVVGGSPGLEMLLELDPIPDVPIDPAVLSRDPEVGAAYAADPLVYHGPFRRETLQTFIDAVAAVASGETFGGLPTLWIHGTHDQLVPYDVTKPVVERLGGSALEQIAYADAEHEIFNETNRDEVLGDVTSFLKRTLAL